MKQFEFQMYAPTSTSDEGVQIVDRVSVQLQGKNLELQEIVSKFSKFLIACGYEFIEIEVKQSDIERD